MKKLFWLALLTLAFMPAKAEAAARFAVCTTTCTWDNSSTAMWSTTSGGATGASAPTSSDDVTLDAATCVGGTTCTITTFSGTISINSISAGACTASTTGCILEASTNNTNFTIGTNVNFTGSGTRTVNMGTGTWTLSNTQAQWIQSVATNLTLNAASSTIAFTGTPSSGFRRFAAAGAKTFGTITISASNGWPFSFSGSNGTTITTLTIAAPNFISVAAASTVTVTNFTNITGSSSSFTSFATSDDLSGTGTFSSGNNFTCTWCTFHFTTWSGAGTFTGNNSINLGANTGITINAPSFGGGGGGRIIGG